MSLSLDRKFNHLKFFFLVGTKKDACMGYIEHYIMGKQIKTGGALEGFHYKKHPVSIGEVMQFYNVLNHKHDKEIFVQLNKYKQELEGPGGKKYEALALTRCLEVIDSLKAVGLNQKVDEPQSKEEKFGCCQMFC